MGCQMTASEAHFRIPSLNRIDILSMTFPENGKATWLFYFLSSSKLFLFLYSFYKLLGHGTCLCILFLIMPFICTIAFILVGFNVSISRIYKC